MYKLFTSLFLLGALCFSANTVLACEQSSCPNSTKTQCECSKDCTCGCQDGEKCTCDKDYTCGCQDGEQCVHAMKIVLVLRIMQNLVNLQNQKNVIVNPVNLDYLEKISVIVKIKYLLMKFSGYSCDTMLRKL